MDKYDQYQSLVTQRKACKKCHDCGLINSAFHGTASAFDHSTIGAWTRWQGDLDAPIMVIGKEWDTIQNYIKFEGKNWIKNKTDLRLSRLFKSALDIDLEPFWPSYLLYFTNAALCYIDSESNNKSNPEWYLNCNDLLKKQIDIVKPEVIICLGHEAFYATQKALNLNRSWDKTMKELVSEKPIESDTMTIFPVFHPSPRNPKKTEEQHLRDWKKIDRYIRKHKPQIREKIKAAHKRLQKRLGVEVYSSDWYPDEDVELSQRSQHLESIISALKRTGKLPEYLK